MKRLAFASLALLSLGVPALAAPPSYDEALAVVCAARRNGANDGVKKLCRDLHSEQPTAGATARVAPPKAALPSSRKTESTAATWPESKPVAVLLVRDAYSVQSFLSEQADLSDNGASLSYTRDGIANSQTIAGKGAVFAAISQWILPATNDPNVPRLAHYSLVPGVEWDIKSKNNLRQLSGPVTALFGSEFLIRTPWVATSFLKTNAVYTTDASDGRAELYGAEVGWQPIIPQARIGTTTLLNKQLDLWLGFHPTLNSDFFHVGKSGDFTNLVTGRDYLWVGPKVMADLSFHSGPLERFSLFLKYFYLYDVLHTGSQNVNYGQIGGKAKLVEWRNPNDPTQLADLSLIVRYTNGTALRTLERNNELYAGLTFKFGNLPKAPQ